MKKPARAAKASPPDSKSQTGKPPVKTAAGKNPKMATKPAATAAGKAVAKPSGKPPAKKAVKAAGQNPNDSSLKAGRAVVHPDPNLEPEPAVKKSGRKPTGAEAPATRKITASSAVPASIPPSSAAGAATPKKVSQANGAAAPKEKERKPRLVRDSFTMPESEYRVLGEVKKACIKAGFEVKKSQLLRVGVALIRQMDTASLKLAISALAPLKAGRPPKDK